MAGDTTSGGTTSSAPDGPGPDATAHAPASGRASGRASEPRRPGVPGRLTAALLFGATVLGGALGAGIGWGLVDVGCRGDCTFPLAVGTILGGALGATGVGVVAVLVLRAMNEWRLPHAAVRGGPGAYPLIRRAGGPPAPSGPPEPVGDAPRSGQDIPGQARSEREVDVEVEGSGAPEGGRHGAWEEPEPPPEGSDR